MRTLKNLRGVWFEVTEGGDLVPARLTTEELEAVEHREPPPPPVDPG